MLREVLRVIKYIALHYITLANDTVTIGKVSHLWKNKW